MDINRFPDYGQIAEEFKRFRGFHGLSQEDAAELLGVSIGTVHNFESQKGTPKSDTLLLFARQVDSWRERIDTASDRSGTYRPEVGILRRDLVCSGCGKLTPGPEGNESKPVFCCYCGVQVARMCRKCNTLETRADAKFCRVCMFPITEAGLAEFAARERFKENQRPIEVKPKAKARKKRAT